MSAKLLDGKAAAAQIKEEVKQQIASRVRQGEPTPCLVVILVGDNPASASYVAHKEQACRFVGIHSVVQRLPHEVTQQQLVQVIEQYNHDVTVHGILLQLPLPSHLQPSPLLTLIDPQKDVDGFHPVNMGHLALRQPGLRPCTPYGIIKLLQANQLDLTGRHAVIVGASNIVGRPLALELLLAKCTVTVCHRFTHHLAQHVQSADLLVSATGVPGIIQSDWIQPEAVVVDVGFSRLANGTIVGDIDFTTACQRASWITPVPGGVGQMTVAMLMANTLQAATMQEQT